MQLMYSVTIEYYICGRNELNIFEIFHGRAKLFAELFEARRGEARRRVASRRVLGMLHVRYKLTGDTWNNCVIHVRLRLHSHAR